MNKTLYEDFKTQFGEAPSFLVESKQRRERWAHLTEGLDDYNRLCLETMMDNTKKWSMLETSDTSNVNAFTTYAFPLIRRVFPNLIANQLVSVQPITQPTGMIFFLDFLYGTNRNGLGTGGRLDSEALFNPYYAGGRVRGETIGVGTGIAAAYNTDNFPIVADSEIVYVDGVAVSPGDYVLNDTTGALTINAAPAAVITMDYRVAGAEGADDVAEIDFDMSSDSIVAETKKLKARWTLESQQDLMAYHGLAIESELLSVMGDQIRREIDQLIITDLVNRASAGNVNWSAAIPAGYNGSEREYRMTLYDAIIDANTLIYNRRYRNANWIVADAETCSRIEKLDNFKDLNNDAGAANVGLGVEKFGILKNRFTVYKAPWFNANTMLVGYKGSTFMEAGYVYAPYIPLYTTPVLIDPNDFTPRRGVMSRFGRKEVISDFYATVTIT